MTKLAEKTVAFWKECGKTLPMPYAQAAKWRGVGDKTLDELVQNGFVEAPPEGKKNAVDMIHYHASELMKWSKQLLDEPEPPKK